MSLAGCEVINKVSFVKNCKNIIYGSLSKKVILFFIFERIIVLGKKSFKF